MQRVRINTLKPGQAFPKSVFLPSGQKLLGPWVPLTDRHLELMRRQGETEVLFAEDVAELEKAGLFQSVDSTRLAVGQRATEPLMARSGQWVLEEDEEVEPHHLDALAAGGGAFKATTGSAADARRKRLDIADILAEQLECGTHAMPLRVTPLGQAAWVRADDAGGWPSLDGLNRERTMAVDMIRKLYARVEAGLPMSAEDFYALVDDLLDKLANHPSRFTQLALLVHRNDDHLPDHAYTVAVLATAIAARLHWSRQDARLLGLAALLADVGMLLVPHRIRVGSSELTDLDRARVQKHPIYALAMLQHVEGLPAVVKLAALQHHERENGNGYPRARRKDQICDLARVLAVADCFAAATSHRTFRKKKLPYAAMEETLRAAAAMVYWAPACRALIHAAGLFPVGSYVKLSTGNLAHVVGSNPAAVDRPLVRILDDEDNPGVMIDLSLVPKSELAVVRPIDMDQIAA